MSNIDEADKGLNVRLSEGLRRRFKALCALRGETVQAAVERMVEEQVRLHEATRVDGVKSGGL